jgi:hypothetical protein
MTQIKKQMRKAPFTGLKNSIGSLISAYSEKYSEVFGVLSKPWVPMGTGLLEAGHLHDESGSDVAQADFGKNRYSVLYTIKAQYHHVGCSSQMEAQSVLAGLMTDGNRIPVGIYDETSDTFEWEMIGQYFHSQDPADVQEARSKEVLTVVKALRRRDGSWQPGHLQRPGLFA